MTTRLPDAASKPAYVREMFTRIAARYDLANDAMTLGHHRAWKAAIVKAVSPRAGESALDLATGTGDIAFRLAKAVGTTGKVVGLDLTPAMLDVARARGPELSWQEGDMLALPFEDASFDVVTIGFGLRNTADVDKALAEARRVLRPGGRLASLDLAKPRRAWVAPFLNAYSYGVVPTIGAVVGGDGAAYRYLPASNESFPTPDELASKLSALGFTQVVAKELLLGAAAIVSGRLPG